MTKDNFKNIMLNIFTCVFTNKRTKYFIIQSFILLNPKTQTYKALTESLNINSLSAKVLLITFANSLEPDQAHLSVGPDLDPTCLTF